MKFIFEDGTVLDHQEATVKIFEADGTTPASKDPAKSPMFGREYVFVLGPVRLVGLDTTKDSDRSGE
jgi:hypothetical protein